MNLETNVYTHKSPAPWDEIVTAWRECYSEDRRFVPAEHIAAWLNDRFHASAKYVVVEEAQDGGLVGLFRVVPRGLRGLPVEEFCEIQIGSTAGSVAEVQRMCVRAAFRKKRFENAPFGPMMFLMQQVTTHCFLDGVDVVIADSFLSNDLSPLNTFRKLGFMPVGNRFRDPELRVDVDSVPLALSRDNLIDTYYAYRDRDALFKHLRVDVLAYHDTFMEPQ